MSAWRAVSSLHIHSEDCAWDSPCSTLRTLLVASDGDIETENLEVSVVNAPVRCFKSGIDLIPCVLRSALLRRE